MKRINLTESQLGVLFETVSSSSEIDGIVNYIKSFGQKGKLPSFDGKLNDYYDDYLKQAYEWASEKLDSVRRDGFAYFKSEFRVNVLSNFRYNKRNLIYVERSIDIDVSKGFDNLQFKSVGECWSWKPHNGRSYCADFGILNDNIAKVILCGYVHPDSVDWLETIYLNSYDMKNETEIRMNDNALVEVAYLRVGGKKYYIGGSFLLNASSDKYNKNRELW